MNLKKIKVDGETTKIPNFLRHIMTKYIFTESSNETYTIGEALCLYVLDHLFLDGYSDKALGAIVNSHSKYIIKFGNEVLTQTLTENADKYPICKLGIMDNKYCCIDGCLEFIDIDSDTIVERMPSWPIKTVIYNLTAIFFQRIKLEQNDVQEQKQHGLY